MISEHLLELMSSLVYMRSGKVANVEGSLESRSSRPPWATPID